MEAIRYGDRRRCGTAVPRQWINLTDQERVRGAVETVPWHATAMDVTQVQRCGEDFERHQARRLQPHFIESFFRPPSSTWAGTVHSTRTTALRDHAMCRQWYASRGRLLGGPVCNAMNASLSTKKPSSPRERSWQSSSARATRYMDAVTDLILERLCAAC